MDSEDLLDIGRGVLVLIAMILLSPLLLMARWLEARREK